MAHLQRNSRFLVRLNGSNRCCLLAQAAGEWMVEEGEFLVCFRVQGMIYIYFRRVFGIRNDGSYLFLSSVRVEIRK